MSLSLLTDEEKKTVVKRAKEHTEKGTCFLCRIIVKGEKPMTHEGQQVFPEDARQEHLILHCLY